tara:strand:+ start:634 stop:2085 length:1452 start_codon:yes stop_codon:yes gene_type:complete
MANLNFAVGAVAVVDKWVEYASRAAGNLCCSNPKCVHLVEHVVDGDDNVSFKDLGCESTVDVNVNGKLEKRYRFGPTDTIHLGSRSLVCPKTNKLEVDSAPIVCGDCMAVGAHVGRGGVCRACVAEAPDDVDISTLPRADPHGPRITALEAHNANSYNEADALEQIREEALSNANANPGRGGAEVQRVLLEDRKAELTKATATASAAKKIYSETKKHLKHMEQGYDSKNPRCEDIVLDEDEDEARDFFIENKKNVALLREHYPQCALYWYGEPPTEEAIAEAKGLVDSTLAELNTAKAAMNAAGLAVTEAEAELAKLGQDYDDAAAAAEPNAAARGAVPKKGGKKFRGKLYSEMDDDEKTAFNDHNVLAKEKRKQKAVLDKSMIENYPRVYRRAKKYQQAVEEKKYANEARAFQEKVQLDWLEQVKNKPNGWDAEKMQADFKKYCGKRRRQEEEKEKDAEPVAAEEEEEEEGEEEEEEEEEDE